MGHRFVAGFMWLGCLALTGCAGPIEPGSEQRTELAEALLAMPGGGARNLRDVVGGEYIEATPSDDAPLEALVRYEYQGEPEGVLGGGPSAAACNRLVEAAPRWPTELQRLLRWLPTTPEAVAAVRAARDQVARSPSLSKNRAKDILECADHWLLLHDPQRTEDLARVVEAAGREPRVGGLREMAALARRDWPRAEPILQRHARDPRSETGFAALCVLHAERLARGDPAGDLARLRAMVADARGDLQHRSTVWELGAMHWPGRDRIYLASFSDPALVEAQEWWLLYREPEEWVPRIVELLDGKDRVARDRAVKALCASNRPEALRALLPWLDDRRWADGDRTAYLESLQVVSLPEAVPGLLRIACTCTGDERVAAAVALWAQRWMESGTLYHDAFAESGEAALAMAMLATGAFDEADLPRVVHALGILLRGRSIPERLLEGVPMGADAPGRLLAWRDAGGCADPDLAADLDFILANWPAPRIDTELAARLAQAPDVVVAALAARRAKWFRVNARAELEAMLRSRGAAGAIAAGIAGDPATCRRIAHGRDPSAQALLLATAGLARTPLPLSLVQRMLDGGDGRVNRAAERYLERIDTPESRAMLFARHPGDLLLVGETCALFTEAEAGLRARMQRPDGPEEIHALLKAPGTWSGDWNRIVGLWRDRADLDVGFRMYRARALSQYERTELLAIATKYRVDELPALLTPWIEDGSTYEYVHLTRAGGRRTVIDNPRSGGFEMTGYFHLTQWFLRAGEPLER